MMADIEKRALTEEALRKAIQSLSKRFQKRIFNDNIIDKLSCLSDEERQDVQAEPTNYKKVRRLVDITANKDRAGMVQFVSTLDKDLQFEVLTTAIFVQTKLTTLNEPVRKKIAQWFKEISSQNDATSNPIAHIYSNSEEFSQIILPFVAKENHFFLELCSVLDFCACYDLADEMRDLAGVDGYPACEKLASSGCFNSESWLALDMSTRMKCVKKIFLIQDILPEQCQEIAMEARRIKTHVPYLWHVSAVARKLVLIFEYFESPTLQQLLKDERYRDYEKQVTCMCRITEALAELHAHGIVHGNLKPSNIVFMKNDSVRLIDLIPSHLISYSSFNGSPTTEMFIAPEVDQTRMINISSDIWSLGAIFRSILDKWQLPGIGDSSDEPRVLSARMLGLIPEERPTAKHVLDTLNLLFPGRLSTRMLLDTSILPRLLEDEFADGRALSGGGFGKVYVATEKKTGLKRVIKEVDLRFVQGKNRNHMIREANILKSLQHPNIVKIYVVKDNENLLLMVMEYCSKGKLSDRVKSQANSPNGFPEALVLRWIKDMLLTLHYLHEVHQPPIVHRDLKPDNIFLTSDDIIKLGDFGEALFIAEECNLTTTTAFTVQYCAPEVLNGHKPEVEGDLWSLGLIFYEIMSLEPAFTGSRNELLRKITQGEYQKLSDKVPECIRCMIECLMELNPADRPGCSAIISSAFLDGPDKNTFDQLTGDGEMKLMESLNQKPSSMLEKLIEPQTLVFDKDSLKEIKPHRLIPPKFIHPDYRPNEVKAIVGLISFASVVEKNIKDNRKITERLEEWICHLINHIAVCFEGKDATELLAEMKRVFPKTILEWMIKLKCKNVFEKDFMIKYINQDASTRKRFMYWEWTWLVFNMLAPFVYYGLMLGFFQSKYCLFEMPMSIFILTVTILKVIFVISCSIRVLCELYKQRSSINLLLQQQGKLRSTRIVRVQLDGKEIEGRKCHKCQMPFTAYLLSWSFKMVIGMGFWMLLIPLSCGVLSPIYSNNSLQWCRNNSINLTNTYDQWSITAFDFFNIISSPFLELTCIFSILSLQRKISSNRPVVMLLYLLSGVVVSFMGLVFKTFLSIILSAAHGSLAALILDILFLAYFAIICFVKEKDTTILPTLSCNVAYFNHQWHETMPINLLTIIPIIFWKAITCMQMSLSNKSFVQQIEEVKVLKMEPYIVSQMTNDLIFEPPGNPFDVVRYLIMLCEL